MNRTISSIHSGHSSIGRPPAQGTVRSRTERGLVHTKETADMSGSAGTSHINEDYSG